MLSLLLSPPQRESMCSHWQSFADRDGSCSKEQGQREETETIPMALRALRSSLYLNQ